MYYDGFEYLDWMGLGGKTHHAPAAVALAPDNMVIYAIGTDGQLWGRHFS